MPLRFEATELLIHFSKHRLDFTATTAADYELLAEQFLLSPMRPTLLECRRRGGDTLRYDTVTEEFAVLSSAGVIRTYYRPVPCVARPIPPCHGERTNADYFRKACAS